MKAVFTPTRLRYFSIFKRGMKGVYKHCGKEHIPRYVVEDDYPNNQHEKNGYSDEDRAEKALLGVVGKCLTYQRSAQ